MTVPDFATYSAPEMTEGETFKPHENIGKPLIVQVNELKHGVVTSNTPDGGPAVIVDLVDLDGRVEPYRDVLWMGGAVVDGLKAHAGTRKPVLIVFESRKSKSGRNYASPMAVDAAGAQRASAYYAANGDPFAATFASPSPPAEDSPPF